MNAKKSREKKQKKVKTYEPYVNDGKIIRMTKRRKKGLLRILFSRVGLTAALIFVQFGILYSLYDLFRDNFQWFSGAIIVFTIMTVFYLFDLDMDSTAKLTWLLLITLLPVPGAILLLFTQKDIGHSAIKSRLEELVDQTRGKLGRYDKLKSDEEIESSGTAALCRYLNQSGSFALYKNTQTQYFPVGEDAFEAMISELKRARNFIFLEYFIVDEGKMWGEVLKILADKVKYGVDVRLMYDGMCEVSLLPYDYPQRLSSLGIKCKPFSPIRPFLSTHYNYRDHRKILVIDGKTAFTGGINMADEYINHRERFGHWKDTAIMLKGDAVKSFTLMFLQMWNLTIPTPEWDRYLNATNKYDFETDGCIMPYCDSPLDNFKVGQTVYLDILARAKRYVHIMTPYLILDNELETALKFAALRGVDVKLILPGIPDKKLTYALAKSYYQYLTDAGVKIYEYTPGFLHAKVFVSDDEKAVVGTINLDYRSLYHHFECAAYMYRSSCISDIERDFEETLTKCRAVTPDTIRHEKLFYKLGGSIMRLAAPLL